MMIFASQAYVHRCQQLGEAFHDQLHQALPDPDAHDIDDGHNQEVGQALFLTTLYDAPLLGADLYNQWAAEAGYAPITYIGTMIGADGLRSYLINIVTAIVRIGADGAIQDVHDLRSAPAPVGVVAAR